MPTTQQEQPETTGVDGIGLWDHWNRCFDSPLQALFDLLDNSFDAALPSRFHQHRIASDAAGNKDDEPLCACDEEAVLSKISIQGDPIVDSSRTSTSTAASAHCHPGNQTSTYDGVTITNSASRPIKPICKILEAYSSAKGRDGTTPDGNEHKRTEGTFAETIGENGVGLKQGCAVLSDLSFVCMKTGGKFSLGVLSKSLQRHNGVVLFSHEFETSAYSDGDDDDDNDDDGSEERDTNLNVESLKSEMLDLFGVKYRDTVGQCVKEYGGNSLSEGVNRMIIHYLALSHSQGDGWGQYDHVFRVVVHKVKKHSKQIDDDDDDDSLKDTPYNRAVELLDLCHAELPKHYIHIPRNCEVNVNGTTIDFSYWQNRLVELSTFYLRIDPNVPIKDQGDDWKDSNGKGAYSLRLFAGFDPSRLARGGESSAAMLIYSRSSGRLITSKLDCRKDLDLNAGSSNFGQGLTILVDDMHGQLPLNPTKSAVAWGEQAKGEVHKENFYSWVGALAHCYWSLHYKKGFGQSKELLGTAVKNFINAGQNNSSVKMLDESEFTRYNKVDWQYWRKSSTIRCADYNKIEKVKGRDTLFHFEYQLQATPVIKTKKKRPITATGSAPKEKRAKKTSNPGSSIQAAIPQASRQQIPNQASLYKRKYEEADKQYKELEEKCSVLVQKYVGLKEKHESLKETHEVLREKYLSKKEYKDTAKKLHAENIELRKELAESKGETREAEMNNLRIALKEEKQMRLEDKEDRDSMETEKDAIIDRLTKRCTLLEERSRRVRHDMI